MKSGMLRYCFCLLFLSVSSYGGELLRNGTFEQNFQGWNYPYWEKGHLNPARIVDTPVYGGRKACKIGNPEQTRGSYIYTGFAFDASRPLQLRMMMKGTALAEDGVVVRILCHGRNPDGSSSNLGYAADRGMNVLFKSGGTFDWKEFKREIPPSFFPEGTKSGLLFVYHSPNSKGELLLDEVSVQQEGGGVLPAPKGAPGSDRVRKIQESGRENRWPGDSSFETENLMFRLARAEGNAFHGAYSIRMDDSLKSASSGYLFSAMRPKKKYTLSFYVKGSKTGRGKVLVDDQTYSQIASRSFPFGPEWSRVVLSLPVKNVLTSPVIRIQKPLGSVLFLDAFQLEEGSEAGAYRPAPLSASLSDSGSPGEILVRSNAPHARTLRLRSEDSVRRNVHATVRLKKAFGEEKTVFSGDLELHPGTVLERRIVLLPETARGYYVAEVSAKSGDRTASYSIPFAVTDPPLPPSDSAFFGQHFGPGDFLRSIGASWRRTFFSQHFTRKQKGKYSFPDPASSIFRKYGIRMMDTFNISKAPPPEALRYLSEAVAAMPDTRFFEIENEPDLTFGHHSGKGWSHGADQYAELLNLVIPQLRKLRPDAKFMGCGVSGVDFNSNFPFLKRVLERAGNQVDILAVHPYSSARYIGSDGGDIGPEANEVFRKTRALADIVRRSGGKQKIWFGEIGWALDTDEDFLSDASLRHAAYAVRLMILGKAAGVEKVLYFLPDTCIERGHFYYGLWRRTLPLPGAGAYAALSFLLEGSEVLKVISNSDIHCMIFRHRDGKQLVTTLWTSANRKVRTGIDLPSSGLELRDLFNNPLPVSTNGVNLELSGNPVYLKTSGIPLDRLEKALRTARYDLPPVSCSVRLSDSNTLMLQIRNQRSLPLSGTFDPVGFPSEKLNLKPDESKTFVLKSKESFNCRKIKWSVSSNLGRSEGEYRAEFLSCPRGKPDFKSPDLPENGRLEGFFSREHLLPNDPGNGWNGADDLSVESAISYDTENLYLAVNVRDDIPFNPYHPGTLWRGDSIQLAVDTRANALPGVHSYDEDDYELGFALTTKGSQKEITAIYESGRSRKVLDAIGFSAFRMGKQTCYRIAIPWSALKMDPAPGRIFGLNFTANDNDGFGTRFWMGITPGIVEGKNPYAYRKFVLE